MDFFAPFSIKIEYKGQLYSGIVAPFPGIRNNLPYFFRVSFGITYWADLSFQDGYWKTFNGGIDQELIEKVCDFIEAYYE